MLFQPTDIDKTTVLLFATRWVTHLCAPTFVFLAGASVYLQMERGRRGWTLSQFLLLRGLWLIILELTIVSFGFNFAMPFVFLQVIWAIGVGMILLAFLAHLGPNLVGAIGLALLLCLPLADQLGPVPGSVWALPWAAFMRPAMVGFAPGFIAYPALPWFAIMALGFGMARVLMLPAARRDRLLMMIGAAMIAAFLLLRASQVGDPLRWSVQETWAGTILSFINVSKYPPSLDFTLVTLGLALVIAPLLKMLPGFPGRLLLTFGQVPLFVYLIHIYAAHGLAMLLGVFAGLPAGAFANFLVNPSPLIEAGWGYSLGSTYVFWVLISLGLYPIAYRYALVKAQGRHRLLSYL